MNTSRRRPQKKALKYVKTRQSQLAKDRAVASDPMDQAWYDRLMDELRYVEIILEHDDKLHD